MTMIDIKDHIEYDLKDLRLALVSELESDLTSVIAVSFKLNDIESTFSFVIPKHVNDEDKNDFVFEGVNSGIIMELIQSTELSEHRYFYMNVVSREQTDFFKGV